MNHDTNSFAQDLKARLLLGATAVLFVAVAGYLAYARGVFDSTQTLRLVTDDSEGVAVGMDLTFAGFPLGRVTRVELAPDGQARITVEIPEKNAHWLKTSSVFTIERNMIGGVRIRAYSGVMSDPPLPDDVERPLIRGDAFGEIQKLVLPLRQALENLVRVTELLQGPQGALRVIFGNETDARRVVTTINRSNEVLENMNRQVFGANRSDGNPGLVMEAQSAIVALKALLADVQKSVEKADAILADGQAIAGNVKGATDDLAVLRAEIDRNLRTIDALLLDISRKWPFSKGASDVRLP